MSIDTDTPAEESRSAEELARSLGSAIAEMPAYEQFLERKAAVEADEEAQEQIDSFQEKQAAYLEARERGTATREDLRELQQAQQELHEIPVMREYLQAENDLELRLQALNAHISEELDIDFGEKAGGCCQD